jgi:uncharacterized protein YifE (UPF0438 family)
MKIFTLLVFTLFLIINTLHAQKLTADDYKAYIKKYKDIAVNEMRQYRIPASITLAQGMIESGCGKSLLALESNNHFGIKCHKEWTGEKYFYDDDEKNECFRKYTNIADSYRDHSLFLTTRPRYASLFLLPPNDYVAWAKGLKQAGYATNPEYATILIRAIETHQLYIFDDTLKTIPIPTEKEVVKVQEEEIKNQGTKQKAVVSQKGNILFNGQYNFPKPDNYDYMYTSDAGRKVYTNNEVPFVFAKEGDSWFSIAKEFNIYSFQVYKQNDLGEKDPITNGQMIYLEPKKKKNSAKTYITKTGDSMYSIAQEKCIRLKNLFKYNNMVPGNEPSVGTSIRLVN